MKGVLYVGIGGAAGSMLRYVLQGLLNRSAFPGGTLAVNILGCLLIGVLWGLASKTLLNDFGRILLMTGFCGGFTTLSAFSYESNLLLQSGRSGAFLLYAAATFGGGLLATFAGYKLIHG
ncbi:fluoride efflux transporter CrcB [Flaviaesturariibacter flavus]|uniref:Fluoride-specific ion channel FluC n=1 Tax=Flaviaesturariibacter flavus TaxID=2502780 RepID=A0A4R1B6P8_9BACT|nr:fluoride efflux transporter CrcB [Flaviaesturariibacter flavus]TCJ12407.1 fluoride efflux transporter CrcB [Flaviaesturariibacter flavus]